LSNQGNPSSSTAANPGLEASNSNSLNPDKNTILRELTTAVLLLSPDIEVTWMNAAAENLLGVSLKRAQYQNLATLAPGLESLADLCSRAIREQHSFGQTINLPNFQRETGDQELAVRVSLLAESRDNRLLVELFDITHKHQLDRENALVVQHGVSRRMLRQLAHEIRNPLGGLRGAAQLLERELHDASLHEFTQIIIGEADRLAALMDSLLGPNRQPNRKLLNIHELLERVATIVESEWSRLTVKRDYDPSLPELLLDRDQLIQALLNLLRNAAQATDGQGTIVIRTRILTNHILHTTAHKLVALIEIEDNGPGVPADIADTLFYPLVTGRPEGTGLGLPLAQDLVNRHQGLIEYESTPTRTVFRMQLPVVPAQSDS
jgi:two-component system nitrogen regulation sensor histidine kinase GlnL